MTSANEHIEFDKICRGCMNKQMDMKPLYGASLDEMFRTVVNVNVSFGDGLPEQMCVQCVLQISRAFRFRQQCEKIDNLLRSYLTTKLTQITVEDKCDIGLVERIATPTEEMKMSSNLNVLETNFLADSNTVHPKPSQDTAAAGNLIFVQKIETSHLQHENQYIDSVSHHENILFETNPSDNEAEGDRIDESNIELCDVQIQILNNIKVEDLPHGNSGDILIENYETFNDNMPLVLASVRNANDVLENNDQPKFTITQVKSQICDVCMIEFETQDDLQSHCSQFHRIINHDFECHVCKKQFAENKVLKRHLKTHSPNKPHVCLTCGMSFTEGSNLTKHKKKHTGELRNVIGKPHLCSVCGKRFKWASSLSKHSKYHTKHKILKCEYCPKYYVEARSLHIHMRSHTGEKPFVCKVCHKGFTQTCNLEKHLRVHTGEKPFLCNICGKGFSQRGYVAIHLRTHTGEKPYECTECGKCFAGSNTLAIHKRTHTGIKPYTCCVCSKSFARQETLIIHHRTHTGEKPHACTICDRAFSSSGHLSGHMRSHTGIKSHACTICDRKFAGSSSLKVHMRSHTGEKPFVCNFCGRAFVQNSSLQAHLLTHEPLPATVDDVQ